MKITGLEVVQYKPNTPDREKRIPWNLLKVTTDEGIAGYGEPVLEGRARTVATAIEELSDYIIGKDPRDIERLWQDMYHGSFYRGGPIMGSAVSGVEQALWDISGKWYGVPAFKLFGGAVRDRIRMYAWIHGNSREELCKAAAGRRTQGFTAIKMCPANRGLRIIETPDKIMEIADTVGAIRETIGWGMDLALDFHGRFSPAMAKLMIHEVEQYRPMFIEEPVMPGHEDLMADIAQSTHLPIAAGERLYTRWGFRELLEKRAASVLQPDVCHAGGIFELKKIAAMAETNFAGIAPHNPMGAVALAASFQVDASCPNFLIQEHNTLGEGLLKEPFVVKDGFVEVTDKPGLGVEIDEMGLKTLIDPVARVHLGTFIHEDDGSFANW